MTQAEWAVLWAGLGVAATLICAWIAERNGFLHLDLARQAHSLNVAKAVPRVGCKIRVDERNELGPGYRPHIWITVALYNEGELPVQNVKGDWKLLIGQLPLKTILPIQRDFLGKCQEDLYVHRIQDSPNWRREGILLDVEVEFFYSVPGQKEKDRYYTKQYYDPETKQMVKRD
jgi:hypothetical protein